MPSGAHVYINNLDWCQSVVFNHFLYDLNVAFKSATRNTSMNNMQRLSNYFIQFILVFLFFMAIPSVATAKDTALDIPENAHTNRYGSGWECDRGYRPTKNSCVAIKLPENAFLTDKTYGRGWDCMRSFRERNGSCVAIKIPPNAYLDSFGDNWNCNRGYKKVSKACVLVNIPKNGYLVELNDKKMMIDSLNKLLLDEKLRENMGRESSLIARNKFSLKECIDKYQEVITSASAQ